jgi:hypothetical protein
MFKQYDVIQTSKTISGEFGTLKRGSKGTIVEIYKAGGKTGYDVEFFTSEGRTKALVVLTAEKIEQLKI